MRTIYLDRYEITEHSTRSRLVGALPQDLFGIEKPWNSNEPFKSCIPEGVYMLIPHHSPKFKQCFIIVGGTVTMEEHEDAARFACLFHVANWADQVEGCVGIGMGETVVARGPMVTRSRDAMNALIEELRGPVQLIIRARY